MADMKIEFELPDKIKLSDTRVIHDEKRRGVKKRLESVFRKELNRSYYPLKIPICCEYCQFVGERQWHCHNPESIKNHINVMPWDVCSQWLPNQGLLMFLHRRHMAAQRALI
jgi:hypothetical protein